jgi:GxxExxY protein
VKIYYMKESDLLCRLAETVQAELGNGYTKDIYMDALESELASVGIPFQREQSLPIYYKDQPLRHSYTVDFLIADKIAVIIGTQDKITDQHRRQMLTILHASNKHLGIFITFSKDHVRFSRVVLNNKYLNSTNIPIPGKELAEAEAT